MALCFGALFTSLAAAVLLTLRSTDAVSSVLLSAPFDNFRIECAQMSGAQRLGIRMIESQGLKRQDAVYALSCDHIDQLYALSGASSGLREMEREDCRYSGAFDPIIQNDVNFTCAPREYVAGIVRLADTRVQLECCRLRTRDEVSCEEREFLKPFGPDSRTEIELNGKLINALAIRGHYFLARFCDLTPRRMDLIMADVKTPRPTTLEVTTMTPQQKITTTSTVEPTTIEEEEIAAILQPKRIIKVSQKSQLSKKWSTASPNSGRENDTTTTSLATSPTTDALTTVNHDSNLSDVDGAAQAFKEKQQAVGEQPMTVSREPGVKNLQKVAVDESKTAAASEHTEVTTESSTFSTTTLVADAGAQANVAQTANVREVNEISAKKSAVGNTNETDLSTRRTTPTNEQQVTNGTERAFTQRVELEAGVSSSAKAADFKLAEFKQKLPKEPLPIGGKNPDVNNSAANSEKSSRANEVSNVGVTATTLASIATSNATTATTTTTSTVTTTVAISSPTTTKIATNAPTTASAVTTASATTPASAATTASVPATISVRTTASTEDKSAASSTHRSNENAISGEDSLSGATSAETVNRTEMKNTEGKRDEKKLAESLTKILRARNDVTMALKRSKAAGLPQAQQAAHGDVVAGDLAKSALRELDRKVENQETTAATPSWYDADEENSAEDETEEALGQRMLDTEDGAQQYDDEKSAVTPDLTKKRNERVSLKAVIAAEHSSSASHSTESSLGAQGGIEKVISLAPAQHKYAKMFGAHSEKLAKLIAERERGERTREKLKFTSAAETPNAKRERITTNKNNNDNEADNDKVEATTRQTLRNNAKTLAPFDAFPSPPPATHRNGAARLASRPPLRSHQTTSTTVIAPSTMAQKKEKLSTKSVADNVQNGRNEDSHKAENVENNGVNGPTPRMHISTRFTPATRTPFYRRKYLSNQSEEKEEDVVEVTARSPTVKAQGKTLLNKKTPRGRHRNNPSDEPYVDEETNGSPFDYAQQLQLLPTQHERRKQEEVLAAETAASKSATDKALEDEIAAYEAQLRQKQQRSKLSQEAGASGLISASGGGRGRFEKTEPRFDKQGPFDLSAEIRRSPAHKDADEATLYDIRQQILERQLARKERKKRVKSTTAASVSVDSGESRRGFTDAESIDEPRESKHREEDEAMQQTTTRIEDGRTEAKTKNYPEIMTRDGVRQFSPPDEKPVQMPNIIVYDMLDAKNLPWAVKEKHLKNRMDSNVIVNALVPMSEGDKEETENAQTDEVITTTTSVEVLADTIDGAAKQFLDGDEKQRIDNLPSATEEPVHEKSVQAYRDVDYSTTSETISVASEEIATTAATMTAIVENADWTMRTTLKAAQTSLAYDPTKFYYVPTRKRKPEHFKENVLTFCSKETAIRDANSLIIACGSDDGPWKPDRCPASTACFAALDSTYHICCPVATH